MQGSPETETAYQGNLNGECQHDHDFLGRDLRIFVATESPLLDHPEARFTFTGKVCDQIQSKQLHDDGKPLPDAKSPSCRAKTRSGGTCGHKVIPGKTRCRFHGGKSTGPRTAEGRARIAEAQRKRWAQKRQSAAQREAGSWANE